LPYESKIREFEEWSAKRVRTRQEISDDEWFNEEVRILPPTPPTDRRLVGSPSQYMEMTTSISEPCPSEDPESCVLVLNEMMRGKPPKSSSEVEQIPSLSVQCAVCSPF
jgi:hypothetical protein